MYVRSDNNYYSAAGVFQTEFCSSMILFATNSIPSLPCMENESRVLIAAIMDHG
jgi:hypothetical protein